MKIEDITEKINYAKLQIKQNIESMDKREKATFAILGGLIVAYPGVKLLSKVTSTKIDKDGLNTKKNVLMLVDVENDKKGIKVIDKDGEIIDYNFDNSTLAIIGEKSAKTKSGKMVEVALVSEDGNITLGYMDGKFLADKCLDKITVKSNCFDIFNISSIDSVSLNSNEKLQDEKRVLLPSKSEVLAATVASNEDSRTKLLREVVLIYDNKFVKGFVDHRYLFNSNFDENDEKEFKVSVPKLNLREEAGTFSESICELSQGDIVKIINNVENINDGEYDWAYVAYSSGEGKNVQFGWVAKKSYVSGYEEDYLSEVTNQESLDNIGKRLQLVVSVSGDYLNMRSDSSLDSEVIATLSNNTVLFTSSENFFNPIESDGVEWVKVTSTDGTTNGWVSKEYVSIADKSNVNVEEYKTNVIDFGRYGEHVGNFGIDINLTTDSDALDNILRNGIPFNASDYVNNTESYKPSFVVIKCGATGFGNEGPMRFATLFDSEGSNYESLINVCQENNVPFAIYYFSQATNEEEAKKEIEVVKKAHELASKYSLYSKNIFMDFECYGVDNGINYDARIKISADMNGKDYQTKITNTILNFASSTISDADIRIYTDANTLDTTINYASLEDKYKTKYNWIVNVNYNHHDKLLNLGLPGDTIGMFQIGVDVPTNNTWVDLDFMYEEFYKEFISNIKNNLEQESSFSESHVVNSEPELSSRSCVVLDADTNEVIYGVNEDSLQSPASITKILSCYLGLKYGDLDDYITYTDETVHISNSKKYPADEYNSSFPYIVYTGNKIKLRDALRLALYQSDNSTTYSIEKYIEKKCKCDFIELMNKEAKEMGCENYNFTNSFGYEDPEHLVSAHDMARIMSYILNNPTNKGVEIDQIMSEQSYTFEDGTTINSQNIPYYNETKGIKTGGHDMARGTIVEFVKRGNKTLVAVNMGTYVGSSFEQWDNVYVEENKIIDYAYSKLNNNIEPCMYESSNIYEDIVGSKKLVMKLMNRAG